MIPLSLVFEDYKYKHEFFGLVFFFYLLTSQIYARVHLAVVLLGTRERNIYRLLRQI